MAHALLNKRRVFDSGKSFMLNRAFAVVISLLYSTLSASAGVYKWADEQGRIHYSDSPPAEVKSNKVDIKINSIKGLAVVSSFTSRASASSDKIANVRIFTTPWCGYCKKAKTYLQTRKTPFEELDVEASDSAKAEYQSIGGRGVPVILVGNQRMDGYSEERLEWMLKSAGL
jgi:glutaredoxin